MNTVVLILSCMLLGFTATLTLGLREVSFTRLAKRLTARGREQWMEKYRQNGDDYLFATATIRTMSIVVVLLSVGHFVAQWAPQVSTLSRDIILFVSATALISICGIGIPQALARYVGEALLASRIGLPSIRLAAAAAWPLNRVHQVLDLIIRRLAGVPATDEQTETEQMEQEVLEAVEEAVLHGAVDRTEREMIESVMELDEATAEKIMTPRTELVATDKSTTLAEVKTLIKLEGHSRIPVFEGTVDRVLGLVYAKDLLHVNDDEPFALEGHLRSVAFVPQTKSVRDLLAEFQSGKAHAAIVLDEYGGTAGLVTIEDILEELVGEIADEFEPPEPEPIVRIDKGILEVDSRVHVDEINDILDVQLPEEDDYETIGGYVFSTLGKIPTAGEELVRDGVKILILEAEERRITRLRIQSSTAQN